MQSKTLWVGAVILGIIFCVIAFVYWSTPANHLPSYFPGYDSTLSTIHFKHGLASFLLGLILFVFAWFKSGKKSADQK